jgi:cytochrome b subunit of formate dehydrogenase/nitrate/TMAO reductase-like tetraheme cytochrome c subunit
MELKMPTRRAPSDATIHFIALAFAAVVAILFAATASAQTLTSADCLSCHKDMTPLANFDKSVHAPVDCTGCHADVKVVPHDPAPARPNCTGCHDDAVKEYATSAHARKNGPWCTGCHGPAHQILPKSDPNSRTYHLRVPGTCSQCHKNQYATSVHGVGVLKKGLMVSAVCSDCHGAHAVSQKRDPAVCKKCHEGIFNQFELSTHGQLWKAGNEKGPVCVTCHKSHEIRSTETAAFRVAIPTGCSNCHAKEAPTYRDSFHGQATALGFAPSAKCSDCHTPHFNLPKSDPRSSIAPANIVKTCAKCHPNANANFASFQPHADPHDKLRSPQLYYVYNWLMKWLLIITFGFFGIHTLLWLQRSIVAAVRHEVPKHEAGIQWVTRFHSKDRLTHIAIVVSFLILAATGLPLLYSHMPWGKTLAEAMGGVGITSILHRVFAIVTFGYAFFHLGHIIRGMARKDVRMFRGPDSMLPQVRDLVDMKNMFRWFFYRGPWPRFDRWAYWEKFDYFAVFWGVPVIGLSGLMLWIAPTITKVLPGWALNVAMLVHGEEALLAVGFIFTFHFFHNHLRPENFPLDTVMFTGKLPMARFREERPDEYERLMAEGTLDEVLTGPPTEGQMQFARTFGFLTFGIGLILIVAIYVTFFGKLI